MPKSCIHKRVFFYAFRFDFHFGIGSGNASFLRCCERHMDLCKFVVDFLNDIYHKWFEMKYFFAQGCLKKMKFCSNFHKAEIKCYSQKTISSLIVKLRYWSIEWFPCKIKQNKKEFPPSPNPKPRGNLQNSKSQQLVLWRNG